MAIHKHSIKVPVNTGTPADQTSGAATTIGTPTIYIPENSVGNPVTFTSVMLFICAPGTLLSKTPSTTINSTGGWQTINLEELIVVEENQVIWMSWVYENIPGVRYISSPGILSAQSTESWSGGMPSVFGTSSFDAYQYSIYTTILRVFH